MISKWPHRAALALLAASAMLLASCGGGSVERDVTPQRFIVVGDGFQDVGQAGHVYTVNDGTLIWIQQLAAHYGLGIAPQRVGGTGYAQGGARLASPDPSGGNAPSVVAQVDAMLAQTALTRADVVFINGGMNDIVDAVQQHGVSPETEVAVTAAADVLGAQVRRLVTAGATRVVVTGVYNLGHTPWARALGIQDGAQGLTTTFNSRLLNSIVDLGQNVLYFDAAQFFNFIFNGPENYQIENVLDGVCTTPTAATCTPETVVTPNYNRFLYADGLHFTPEPQRWFVNENFTGNAYTRFKDRW